MATREVGIILDVPIDCKSSSIATQDALDSIERKADKSVFACANPHSIIVAQSDPAFLNALRQASLVVPDGVGVVLMAKIAGICVGERITGADYFFSVLNGLNRRGFGRVFFLGSSPKVLALIAERFIIDFSSLTLCGTYAPPYGLWSVEENQRILATINRAKPDILWVGMTAPKQEKWVEENRRNLDVPLIGSVGAVFDFYAGTHRRAPQWMCRVGLEWIYRFMMEPKRLWKRYCINSPWFIILVFWRHILKR
jgi:N-acetylglucosaminyldiphosphoundecaprenol N-acetyl-beta-D-mannosaminyltransferase